LTKIYAKLQGLHLYRRSCPIELSHRGTYLWKKYYLMPLIYVKRRTCSIE